MKYEYKAINIFAIKQQRANEFGTPPNVTQFDVMNEEGEYGWRCLNPQDGNTLYFEKATEVKKGKKVK